VTGWEWFGDSPAERDRDDNFRTNLKLTEGEKLGFSEKKERGGLVKK
jgi:hypothetical protein